MKYVVYEVCMGKMHVTVTVEEAVISMAKEKGLNISAEVERALRNRVVLGKKDLPEESMQIICTECKKEIFEGFICKPGRHVLCEKCQRNWDMERRCKGHYENIEGVLQHEHIAWPSPKRDPEIVKEAKKVSDEKER